ncbi:lipid A deacylase LpxR family protein [Polaribacter sp. MSW13]|uniref:Lipid A deacylase LpxR family protein n=1 Tax=Polaribacter marinus TaxID=2916838 RepID=A0A9X1VLF4_9FLAO|nr:lipid A deacylase LpxR family protein [Polaribacter marinus]MCI2228198.1 lipid A deacylase LpxR family protein [Polaribacter marinus]
MKYRLFFYFFLISLYSFSQEKFSKEISLITDNDLYVSKTKDRYYTSGVFLKYRYLSKVKKENQEKRILEWQIGQEMYSPYKSVVTSIEQHDRPFAGYLYASFGINRVYKNYKAFNTTLQVGLIGPNSFAKELQSIIHNIYGFVDAVGWKHQIKGAFALNFNADYNTFLAKDASNHFDISWINSAKIGTVYTNISTGFYGRIGFKPLQSILNSIAFNNNLNNETTNFTREAESFIYIKPTLRYSQYDATLQGSFLNKNSDVTKELIPLIFHLELGFQVTLNRFSLGYAFHYHTNKSKGLRYNGNKYGTIGVNYLLH